MKVIDLLNKVANKEDVPKEIKYDGRVYVFDSNQYYDKQAMEDEEAYIEYFGDDYTANFPKGYTFSILNQEVEIVKNNKIEKLDYIGYGEDGNLQYQIIDKINEIIEVLNDNNSNSN